MSLRPSSDFNIPAEAFDVSGDKERQLIFFELKNIRPKGRIFLPREKEGVRFIFTPTGTEPDHGINAQLDETTQNGKRFAEHLEKYPKQEVLVVMTLLQARIYFVAKQHKHVLSSQPKSFTLPLPSQFKKVHRRKFIRIPFNDNFPASVQFQLSNGKVVTRKLRDLSREGMKVKLEDEDVPFLKAGDRLKSSVLKILNREIALGLNIINVYPGPFMGLKMIALSQEDDAWVRDVIKLLMKQILKLSDSEIKEQQAEESEE